MSGKRVLVIDDDALIRLQVCDVLRQVEPTIELLEAGDGELGIAKLDSFDPQLVLLDLFMPNLSGVETLSFIRARQKPPKVLIMSSLDSEVLMADLLKAGADGFIAKPFHPLELVETVQRYLR